LTTEEKLHHFNSIILESTEAECNEAFEEYKQSMDKYFEAHKKERAEKHKLEEKVEADNIKRTASKEYTTEQLHIRRKINHKQEELKNKLLAEVETLMESYFTTEDYKKLLIKQINEAVAVARGEEIHIFLDAKDELLKEELEAACNVQLIADGRTFYGGIRAEIPKKNILIDNSFESKLDNWKETYLIEPGM